MWQRKSTEALQINVSEEASNYRAATAGTQAAWANKDQV